MLTLEIPFSFAITSLYLTLTWTWTRGAHSIRFGGEYLAMLRLNHFQPRGSFRNSRGSFQSSGGVVALNGGPAANKSKHACSIPAPGWRIVRAKWFRIAIRIRCAGIHGPGYVRDGWQVRPNLTVNIGARWEYYPFRPLITAALSFSIQRPVMCLLVVLVALRPTMVCDVGWGQIVPRFGLAYRWHDKTVIRAGYGMSTDSNNWRFFRNNWPLVSNADLSGATTFIPSSSLHPVTLAPYPGLFVGIPSASVPDLSSGNVPLPNNVGIGAPQFHLISIVVTHTL